MKRTTAFLLAVCFCWVVSVHARAHAQEGTPCAEAELNLIFQARPSDGPQSQVNELFDGATETLETVVAAGELGRVPFYAAIVSRVESSRGVASWAVQTRVSGRIRIVEATTQQTAAADSPDGLVKEGFVQVRLPSLLEEPGFYTSTVLSFVDVVTLEPAGTATIIAGVVEARDPQGGEPVSGLIEWIDGCVGCQTPFVMRATVNGIVRRFCSRPSLEVRFLPLVPPTPRFLRCDANADGNYDITDGIFIARHLFRGGLGAACLDTEDCNADLKLDLADVVRAVKFLFLGEGSVAAPYPDCGEAEETISETSCEESTAPCAQVSE